MSNSFEEIEREILEDMKKRRDLLVKAIAELENTLAHPYVSDPAESQKGWKEADEAARRHREEDEHQEIEKYGRLLTLPERKGWVERPPVKGG